MAYIASVRKDGGSWLIELRLVGRATFADESEVARNPRARSAVMRVAERLTS